MRLVTPVNHDFNIYKERGLNENLKNSKAQFQNSNVAYINVVELDISNGHMLFDGNIAELVLRIKSLPSINKPTVLIQADKLSNLPKAILSNLNFELDEINKDWIAQVIYKFSLGEHQIYAKYQTNWLYQAILENKDI